MLQIQETWCLCIDPAGEGLLFSVFNFEHSPGFTEKTFLGSIFGTDLNSKLSRFQHSTWKSPIQGGSVLWALGSNLFRVQLCRIGGLHDLFFREDLFIDKIQTQRGHWGQAPVTQSPVEMTPPTLWLFFSCKAAALEVQMSVCLSDPHVQLHLSSFNLLKLMPTSFHIVFTQLAHSLHTVCTQFAHISHIVCTALTLVIFHPGTFLSLLTSKGSLH